MSFNEAFAWFAVAFAILLVFYIAWWMKKRGGVGYYNFY